MNTAAHRTLTRARVALAGLLESPGLDLGDLQTIRLIIVQLHHLVELDPDPPQCRNCASPLTQPATGRPREYCNDACRKQRARLEATPWQR